jgi:hypothetical protein
MQHIEVYNLLFYKDNKQDLHSSIIETNNKDYSTCTMNIYFIQDRSEDKRLSGIQWHGLVVHKMLNIDYLCSTCQVCQMTKKERTRKTYGLPQPKIAESEIVCMDHDLYGSGGSIYIKDNIQNTLSSWTHNNSSNNQHRFVWNRWSHK